MVFPLVFLSTQKGLPQERRPRKVILLISRLFMLTRMPTDSAALLDALELWCAIISWSMAGPLQSIPMSHRSMKTRDHRCPFWLIWSKNRGPWLTWGFNQLPGSSTFPKRTPMLLTVQELELHFGAFCPGMLGLPLFANSCVFRIKPLIKVSRF